MSNSSLCCGVTHWQELDYTPYRHTLLCRRLDGVQVDDHVSRVIDDLMRSDAVEANPAVPTPAVRNGVLQLHAIQTVRRVRSGRSENVNLLFRRGWLLLSIEQEPQTTEQGIPVGTSTVWVVGHPERDAI